MELNLMVDAQGVVPTADVVEGRFVCLTSHTHDVNFGSKTDLPGAQVPATAEAANGARYVIAWAQDNRDTPIYSGLPSSSFNLRQGFGGSAQSTPFSATVYLTTPSVQEGLTIPSGEVAVAYGGPGTVITVPSGSYIYNAGLTTPGAALQVANTAEDTTDAGKLKYLSAWSTRTVAIVQRYDSTTGKLTVKFV